MPTYEFTSVPVRCPTCGVVLLAKQPQSSVVEAALNCCAGSHTILHLVDLQPVRQAWDAYERCGTGRGMVTLNQLLSCVRELLRSTREAT